MVNNLLKGASLELSEITTLIRMREYEESLKRLFILNNDGKEKSIIEECIILYNLSYCYDGLKRYNESDIMIQKAYDFIKKHKEDYPTQYAKCANFLIYRTGDKMKNIEKICIYQDMYKLIKKDSDMEYRYNLLSSIYGLGNDLNALFEVFNKCLEQGYIDNCIRIINQEYDKALTKKMQVILNRKLMKEVSTN
ncbi:MAG: hypothetical protein ACRDD7_12530 [Peptostreptococcaceae bacterium]